MKERLTKYSNETSHKNGVCCTHFLSDECRALGGECAHGCKWEEAAWERLAAYEDTGLTPQEVLSMKFEWCAMMDALNSIGGGYTRLRELAEADRDGRLVVLPCQSGEHVFALLDNQTHVWECEVEHAVLDGWRKVFAIRPLGRSKDSYYAPFGAFGQTVFLTREAAEKALEAKKDE